MMIDQTVEYQKRRTITVALPDGYSAIQRTSETTLEGKLIVWWEKGYGYEPEVHFKCDGISPLGMEAEGLGSTVDEAITDLLEWFEILDKEYAEFLLEQNS
jgi:hypothetical protein